MPVRHSHLSNQNNGYQIEGASPREGGDDQLAIKAPSLEPTKVEMLDVIASNEET